ncbi:MAG: DNA-processing protein DprA [Eudoraea sp.]
MSEDELIALLRLQCIPHIGDISAKKLIAHCGSASAIFREKASVLSKIRGIGTFMIRELHHKSYLILALRELDYIKKHKIDYCYFLDSNYPKNLKNCIDGPILLFNKGNIDLKAGRLISVVGTRNSTSYGTDFCELFMEEIKPFNPIIVSGFAYGIDIIAQKAAIANGLQTIGCLAHGLNQFYPRVHQQYVNSILENGGFFTEFWSSSSPERVNFLKRNRVIAGLSEATIVVETANKGGSLVTADIADSYNRDIFAVPGRISDKYSLGCNNLLKSQKAHMLTSASDLAFSLGWGPSDSKIHGIQKRLFVELNEEEKAIHDYLNTCGRQLADQIAIECEITIHNALSVLFSLELKGLIRPLPGKYYEII